MTSKLILSAIAGLILCALSACSFHIGIDYQGKTGKSNTTESPNFRGKTNGN